MEITGTGIEDIVLLRDAVRHTRLDIEDFLENGALAETEPEYQNELAFYRKLRDKHDRLADLEIELNKQKRYDREAQIPCRSPDRGV